MPASRSPPPSLVLATPMAESSASSTSLVHRSPKRSFIPHDSSTLRRPCKCGWLIESSRPLNIETYVRDYAGTIGGNAPLTINSVKLCVNEATRDPDKRNLDAAQVAVDACFASADYVEGRTAFIQKR